MVSRLKGAVTVFATDPAMPPHRSCLAASMVRLSRSPLSDMVGKMDHVDSSLRRGEIEPNLEYRMYSWMETTHRFQSPMGAIFSDNDDTQHYRSAGTNLRRITNLPLERLRHRPNSGWSSPFFVSFGSFDCFRDCAFFRARLRSIQEADVDSMFYGMPRHQSVHSR